MSPTLPQPPFPPGPFEPSADTGRPNYAALPAEYRAEMQAYIEDGCRPSPLMEAICSGDLWAAFDLSGPIPEHPSPHIVSLIGWVAGQCPIKSFGNVGAVQGWITAGGLNGRARLIRRQIAQASAYKAAAAQNQSAFRAALSVITGGRA